MFRLVAKQHNNELHKLIALRLKTLRKLHGVTQEDVLNDTGIHIARIEAGKLDITVTTLERLCNYFEVSLEEFFSKGF